MAVASQEKRGAQAADAAADDHNRHWAPIMALAENASSCTGRRAIRRLVQLANDWATMNRMSGLTRARVLRPSLVMLTAVLAAARTPASIETATFAEVMHRVHAYVTLYEDHELSTVIAREGYYQQWLDYAGNIKGERTLLSDYLLLQLPDEDWVALRDVYDVDGTGVTDRAARLKALFAGPREQLGERAMKMAKESARYNLGDLYYRTVNLPTFALRILRPASRKRIVFSKAGEEKIDGTSAWVVTFRETKGPTFSATAKGADIPAHGRFWVEPDTGAVLRSEMILGGTGRLPPRATITVTYRLEPSLGFRIPIEMRERYDNPRDLNADVVVALATYSDFRRFDWRTMILPGPPVSTGLHDRFRGMRAVSAAFSAFHK